MKHHQIATLERNTSSRSTSKNIIPTNYIRSTPRMPVLEYYICDGLLLRRYSPIEIHSRFSTLLRSIFKIASFPNIIIPAYKWLSLPSITPSLGRKVTGTLFGNRHGQVSFAVQDGPRSEPVLLLELAMSTSMLVKEMSTGLVRIALECQKVRVPVTGSGGRSGKLSKEGKWSMYCNGRSCGNAVSRTWTDIDWHVLSTVQSVSVGAGVIPVVEDGQKIGSSEGELLYMRAKFERVVGGRDSEAFYMMNPDGTGGPELSIFLLRI
ncbi:hypothetical protein M5689_014801 [Euphorbia peplus]|nr:hypothetical protein M5689_014801 [Euphorbia peplus]